MRKFASVLAILLAFIATAALLFACNPGEQGGGTEPPVPPADPLESILAQLKEEDRDLDRYDNRKYTDYFWEGNVVYHESVLPLEDREGKLPLLPLAYPAAKILTVRDSTLKVLYEEGRDYLLRDGKIFIPEGSTVPRMTYPEYYPERGSLGVDVFHRVGGGYLAFGENTKFISRQLSVTYVHTADYAGYIPPGKAEKLPLTRSRLENDKQLNLVFFGDSITAGANADGYLGLKDPGMPIYPKLVADRLAAQYEARINYYNTSVATKESKWGVETVTSNLIANSPDLAVIAFGMNDGTSQVSARRFKSNIKTIMDRTREQLPDVEFILIASMLPNPEAADFVGLQEEYAAVLQELEAEYQGAVCLDMTAVHRGLLQYKRYYDMTGNNINHPNNFLARIYAQSVLATVS